MTVIGGEDFFSHLRSQCFIIDCNGISSTGIIPVFNLKLCANQFQIRITRSIFLQARIDSLRRDVAIFETTLKADTSHRPVVGDDLVNARKIGITACFISVVVWFKLCGYNLKFIDK